MKIRLWKSVLVLSVMLIGAMPVAAQEGDEDNRICLPVLRLWYGTPAETQRIRSVAVPDSFKKGRQSCGGPLQTSDLIEWHRRFGTPASARAAFDFIEERDARLPREARRLVAAARANIAKAEAAEDALFDDAPEDEGIDDADTLNARRTARARAIHDGLSAELYEPLQWLKALLDYNAELMSAAEAFRSPALRKDAGDWFARFQALRAQLVAPPERSPHIKGPDAKQAFESAFRNQAIDEMALILQTRFALFDARQNRTEEKMAEVDRLIAAQDSVARQQAAKWFDNGEGDGFCHKIPNLDWELQVACSENPDFERFTITFFYHKAMAGFLHGDSFAGDDFFRFYARVRKDQGFWQFRRTGVDDRYISLKVAEAEVEVDSALGNITKVSGSADIYQPRYALEMLTQLTRLFSPADDPVRFRWIATRALALHEDILRWQKRSGEQDDPSSDRALSYFTLILPHLEEIAGGKIES